MSALRPPASSWFPFPGLTFGFWRRAPLRPVQPAAPRATKQSAATPAVDFDRILAGIRTAPQLEMIEWQGESATQAPVVEDGLVPAEDAFDASSLDARRRKLRDRYIAARFPGIAKGGADLAQEDEVIRAARLLFEDERADDAIELLELAIEESPANPAPALARLEILYLARDASGFVEAAQAYRVRHGASGEAWAEICRLGRALAPQEGLFAGDVAARDHEHYGPWPHTPNWIRAPWDLTAEVAAVEFHQALARTADAARA
jgi:hypothetical protein